MLVCCYYGARQILLVPIGLVPCRFNWHKFRHKDTSQSVGISNRVTRPRMIFFPILILTATIPWLVCKQLSSFWVWLNLYFYTPVRKPTKYCDALIYGWERNEREVVGDGIWYLPHHFFLTSCKHTRSPLLLNPEHRFLYILGWYIHRNPP